MAGSPGSRTLAPSTPLPVNWDAMLKLLRCSDPPPPTILMAFFNVFFTCRNWKIRKKRTGQKRKDGLAQESLVLVDGNRTREDLLLKSKLGSDETIGLPGFSPGFSCILSMYLSMISAHLERPVRRAHSAAQSPRPKSLRTGEAPAKSKSRVHRTRP